MQGANHRLGWGVQDRDAEGAQVADAMDDNIPIHLPKATYRRLRGIAWERHTPLQRLVEEAMEEWLARQPMRPAAPSSN